jgi:non-specific serine/threonine protein kinase
MLVTGAIDDADVLIRESLPLLRAHARQDIVAVTVHTWGCIALEQGDLSAAGLRFAESVRMSAHVPRSVLEPVEGRAVVAVLSGRHELGVRLLASCEQMRAAWGVPAEPWWRRRMNGVLDTARDSLSRAAFARATSAGLAMDAAHAVETALDKEIVRHEALSDRQRMVVELVSQGMTNVQVAAKLGISHRTVESHVHNVKAALNLSTRAQLAAWAQSN